MSDVQTATRHTRTLSKRQNDYVTAKECAEIVNAALREALLSYHVSQESRRLRYRIPALVAALWRRVRA